MRSLLCSFVLVASFFVVNHEAKAAFDSAIFNANDSQLAITEITPSGDDVPSGRQIVIHFNKPVVPVGRMERDSSEIPISIDPPVNCEWRWLNTSSLACQLTEQDALKEATRYRLTIKPGITTENGDTLNKTVDHSFITVRPKIEYSSISTWKSPGTPVVRVTFNQKIEPSSLNSRLFFSVGVNKVAALIEPEPNAQRYSRNEGRVWLATPERELPLDTPTYLEVYPGVLPLQGGEPSIEKRTVVEFRTFPEFQFLGFECRTNNDDSILLTPQDKPSAQKKCNPLGYTNLVFNSPVFPSQLKEHFKLTPDLAAGREGFDPWENTRDWTRLNSSRKEHRYAVNLPQVLQAYQPYLLNIDSNIVDEFGRELPDPIKMMFFTDHRKPNFHFEHQTSVLEKNEETEVPIVLTNLKNLKFNYTRLTSAGVQSELKVVDLPLEPDVSYKFPLGVRSLIDAPSGVVYGTFTTTPDVDKRYKDNTFFAEVTPWAVHAKIGHFNSLVWVTDLVTGNPVKGVKVEIYRENYPGLTNNPKILTESITDESGVVLLDGTEKIDPDLYGLNRSSNKLFVRCQLGEDIALLPLDYNFESQYQDEGGSYIEKKQREKFGHVLSWGTTSQGIYRAGDTIDFKVYVKNQDNRKLIAAPEGKYSLEVTDPMGKNVASFSNVVLNEFGAFHNSFVVPKTGAVGWYQFTLRSGFLPNSLKPMKVLVSDFTPAPFKALCDLNGTKFKYGDELIVSTTASLHAGGPYADAPVRVTVQLDPRTYKPSDPNLSKFHFGEKGGYFQKLHQKEDKVDATGSLDSKFTLGSIRAVYGSLQVESAVRDDRGKYVAATARAEYFGRDRYVGLRQDDWLLSQGKPAALQAVVVDDSGAIVPGTEIEIEVQCRKTVASRVKGAGNAYVTRYSHSWGLVKSEKITSSILPVQWQFVPEEPGLYSVTARIKDSQGRSHSASFQRWAAGKGRVLWSTSDGNGLEIVPAKEEFNIGDKASFLVKNPFPGAKALVTVERFGILKQWVTTLEDSTAVIDVDIEPDYLPGFYLSVSLVSPRVDKPLGEDLVDLGKPTFRMGYVSVPVNDPAKRLKVKVDVDGDQFKPRETVNVKVAATRNNGSLETAPIEYAVAVLDESVLDLVQGGTRNWDIYRGFYSHDGIDVANYHLLMRMIGRQKFEKKGANAGGDGGPDISLRTIFKFVTYWNPSINANEKGEAQFSFEVPDNLTGWRVLVMAVTPEDRMGLGQANFKVNRPTELRPALPNQVMTGDRFRAGFTVMNRTDKERVLKVKLQAEGAVAKSTEISTEVIAPPFKRIPLWLPVLAQGAGEIKFTAKAWDKTDGDAFEKTLSVRPWTVLETAATYGTTVSDRVSEKIQIPLGIRTDAGSIGATVSTSVVGNLKGAFDYMRRYPYICWEQKLSKGVMASHYVQLRNVLPEDFRWDGAEEIPQHTLDLAAEHQAPNGGMVYYVPQDEYVSPYLSAYTALSFNWLREAGYKVPTDVEKRLHKYLDKMLRQDVFPTFFSKGMSSTVRAVALAALAPHGKVKRSDLERYSSHLPYMSLFGKAHFLLAALHVKGTEDLRRQVSQMILSHANETGGKYLFQEKLDAVYSRILSSSLRDNGAVLSALLAYSETPEGRSIGEVPFKLVRYLTQSRGGRDHWVNTQENMFCLNALVEYRRIYEVAEPRMKVIADLNGEVIGETAFQKFIDPPSVLKRPIGEGDPGAKLSLNLQRKGSGRLYYSAQLTTAQSSPRKDAVNSGIEVRREISVKRGGRWQLKQSPIEIERGELVRVDLFVSLPAERDFVVVDDAVPGGLEPVNRDLATASLVDDAEAGGVYSGDSFWHSRGEWHEYGYSHWSFYHRELRHHSVRFYSEYLPAGNYHLSYVAQAISPGEFSIMPTKAEEMYDPDVYGLSQPAILRVKE